VVLQRLFNASPADRVSKALTALGRACRTLFILCDNHEERTRFAIQRQLNRGEARHSLARWLFFANRGEFRVGDYEEVMSKASCLRLLSNAAVLWNTAQIECVVGRLRAGGAEIDPAGRPRPRLALAARPDHPERHLLPGLAVRRDGRGGVSGISQALAVNLGVR
jgi:TnpA family transposase